MEQVGKDLVSYDLIEQEAVATWAGKVVCQVGIEFLKGSISGGSLLVAKISKVLDSIDIPDSLRTRLKRTLEGDILCRLSGNSFPSGTLVLINENVYRPMELINPGDTVIGFDTEEGTWSTHQVLAQWSAVDVGLMASVATEGGGTITSTDDHLFWVSNRNEWIEAADLHIGDDLIGPDGNTRVAGVEVSVEGQQNVWEMDTDDAVREVLQIDKTLPAPDFLSVDLNSGKFRITEAKGSRTDAGADISRALAQLATASDAPATAVPGAKISLLEIVVPNEGTVAGAYEVSGDLLVNVTADGTELVRVAGQVVHVVRIG